MGLRCFILLAVFPITKLSKWKSFGCTWCFYYIYSCHQNKNKTISLSKFLCKIWLGSLVKVYIKLFSFICHLRLSRWESLAPTCVNFVWMTSLTSNTWLFWQHNNDKETEEQKNKDACSRRPKKVLCEICVLQFPVNRLKM